VYRITALSKFRTIFGEKLEDTEMFKFIRNYNTEFVDISDDKLRTTEFFKYLINERKSVSYEYGYDFGVFNLPWGNFRLDHPNSPNKNIQNSRFCGPSSESFALTEIRNVIKLYLSMKKFGWRKRYLPLTGVRMMSHGNKSQFVVLGGNHRSIIGYFLGFRFAFTRSHPLCYRKISCEDVLRWHYVANNLIPKEVALRIFKSFFK
jgi:hypothetical protein